MIYSREMRVRLFLPVALISVVSLVVVACETVAPPAPAPPAEFIVAAADSVFWIRSDTAGIRVRGAPMVLAEVSGRFAELFVADEDNSFYDAVYVGQRLFKRDLISGDSMPLFADTLMRILARGYASANPDERPLGPTEQGSENPRTIASAEIVVLDVLGPWVSYEYRTDVDIIGGTSSHGSRRGVLDLRTGSTSTLGALFGQRISRALTLEGRQQWRMLHDSLVVAAAGDTELISDLDRLVFDPRSFIVGVQERSLHVRFALTQSGSPLVGGTHELFPIPVDAPAWWEIAQRSQPLDGALGERLWEREGYSIVARPGDGPIARVSFALRDGGGTEWRLGFVPSPVHRVMWLDDSTTATGTREALTRAFNEAALYAGDTRIVSLPRIPKAGPVRFRLATLERPAAPVPRRHPTARPRR